MRHHGNPEALRGGPGGGRHRPSDTTRRNGRRGARGGPSPLRGPVRGGLGDQPSLGERPSGRIGHHGVPRGRGSGVAAGLRRIRVTQAALVKSSRGLAAAAGSASERIAVAAKSARRRPTVAGSPAGQASAAPSGPPELAGSPAGQAPMPDSGGGASSVAPPPRRPQAAPAHRSAPLIRLSLAWTAVTVGAIVAGQVPVAAWLAAVCAVAAAQACRSWRSEGRRPSPLMGAAGALIVVSSALAGPLPPAVAAGGILAVTGLAGLIPGWSSRALLLTGAIAVAAGGCGAAIVVDRAHGPLLALGLLAMACAYDVGSYLVGSGAGNSWEGPVAGIAAIGAVTLALAAAVTISNPGAGPWALGGLAALLAPAGTQVASRLLGKPQDERGALRRLDSLILLAPAWAFLAPRLLG